MTWDVFISYEHLRELGISVGIFFLFLLFRKLFTKYIFKIILRISRKGKTNFFPNLFLAFQRPMEWVFVIIGIYVAIHYYPYLNQDNVTLIKVIRAVIIFLITWGMFNLASTSSKLFKTINDRTNMKIDEILIPFLSRTLQFIIIAISISVILDVFGYQIGGFLTGLGLGGLAFSLAAKDALANLFGGIIIITEKPFTIDDWIMTPSVEGTVEDISFRSTKVRTFAQALVTVPNATLVNESITNWSKMGKRQITFNIRLTYDSPRSAIKSSVEKINSLLKNHPEIHQETIFVTVNEYKENGLDILLYFFTETTDWGKYLNIREEINLKILEILDQEGVEIAIPSRKLFLDSDEEEGEK
ncbi:mechanosensitive ion channel family protein [Pseudogracilibacillus auburnensis]|uniref:MscS family membrane protein n=1 Tax=Pseudogracilibacillus auburnensis TaxID=1494959 RepID=A0A2V3VZQ5_9BACI|nr:mechanosensitive ion channel family protein [Pseudogracilibacillus auburnensis]PXW87110.1 MscS family membrane protein [Pseudogracilibacillus auburnensis]